VGANRNPDHNRLDKFHDELISRKVEIYSTDKLNLNHKKVEFLQFKNKMDNWRIT